MRTEAKMKEHIEKNGGRYTSKVDRKTTHLVCTKSQYRKKAIKGQFHQPHPSYVVTSSFDYTELALDHSLTQANPCQCLAIDPSIVIQAEVWKVDIVTLEWLEESLLSTRMRAKKSEKYLVSSVVKQADQRKATLKLARRDTMRKEGMFVTKLLMITSNSYAVRKWHKQCDEFVTHMGFGWCTSRIMKSRLQFRWIPHIPRLRRLRV